MNHCKIVEDLLPLYIDGLTSEETAQYVREHLAKCPSCGQAYRRMAGSDLPAQEFVAPDYKKPLWRSILRIILTTVGVMALVIVLVAYAMWEIGFFAPSKEMKSPDGNKSFTVHYYDDQGVLNGGGAYISTPDGRGRNYRGDETFVDAHVHWAPNSEYYFLWCEFTDRDESFYWGYNAPPTVEYDEKGNPVGYSYHYQDRVHPKDEDFFGMLEPLCREHPDMTQGWTEIEFQFVQWSSDSDAMCFNYRTDDGQDGILWYSIITNTIQEIVQ